MTTSPTPLLAKRVPIADVANLLELLPPEGGLAWVYGKPGAQTGLVGWGSVLTEHFAGPERFSRAHRAWTKWCSTVPGDPIAFASFAFDSEPGNSVLHVPEVAIQRANGNTTLTAVAHPDEVDDVLAKAQERIAQAVRAPSAPNPVDWLAGSRSTDDWKAAVEQAVSRIAAGELDKVVLARDVVAKASAPVDVAALLQRLNLAFPECWTFCVDGLVGATPELLLRRKGEHITSRVLAGTVRRSSDNERDGELAAALLGSDKDQEEHEYAVSSVAAALAHHCTDLHVPPSPSILRLANVQHLATDVTGELADNAPALVLAASLHPTAAVCGTPTERAFAVIRELEGMDRGRYSGPVGWFDAHGDGEFGIALRCAQIENADRTQLRLFAGCGIVAGSTGDAELAESQSKLSAMRNALS